MTHLWRGFLRDRERESRPDFEALAFLLEAALIESIVHDTEEVKLPHAVVQMLAKIVRGELRRPRGRARAPLAVRAMARLARQEWPRYLKDAQDEPYPRDAALERMARDAGMSPDTVSAMIWPRQRKVIKSVF